MFSIKMCVLYMLLYLAGTNVKTWLIPMYGAGVCCVDAYNPEIWLSDYCALLAFAVANPSSLTSVGQCATSRPQTKRMSPWHCMLVYRYKEGSIQDCGLLLLLVSVGRPQSLGHGVVRQGGNERRGG